MDDEADFTVGFVLRNVVTHKIFVEFRDSKIFFHDFRGNGHLVTPRDVIFYENLGS